MAVRILKHAKERMVKYGISEDMIKNAIKNPDSVEKGKFGRKVAHKTLNEYILRIIYEDEEDIQTIITTYKAKRRRYVKV